MSTPEPSVFLESPVVVKPKRRAPRKINLVPWIFLAPAVIVFATYVVIPIFQSFWLSLYDWDGLSPTKKFLGLSNYTELFQDD
ncbi:MAG: sugar ABC transporter permease, partial [Verrucomicrobia bacterium]|nr:sugar ABC transporter permease [Verrucomicrobiota bacterium]